MARTSTPSFVTTIELEVLPWQANILRKRFHAARMVYNKCLSHYLKRVKQLRESKDYRRYKGMRNAESQFETEVRKLDSKIVRLAKRIESQKDHQLKQQRKELQQRKKQLNSLKNQKKKERGDLFRCLIEKFEIREYDADFHISKKGLNWLYRNVPSTEASAIRSQAFKAFDKWMKSGFREKTPKFRRWDQIASVNSRTSGTIRWKNDRKIVEWKAGNKELTLPALIPEGDKIIAHGLQTELDSSGETILKHRVKFTRLLRKEIRGKERFFAQLVHEGEPCKKISHKPNRGIVGIDIGTQTIAAVSEHSAFLELFCSDLEKHNKEIRRIQRAMDRSRRANNTDCFNEDGTFIKGKRIENYSNRYKNLRIEKRELERKQAEQRKNLHGQMVARVLQLGDDIRMEKLQFRSMTKKSKRDGNKRRKRFGKSIGFRAPGAFIERLKKEGKKWGCNVELFDPRPHALSQTCLCGNRKKKSLSKRIHQCRRCGIEEQRDLFSAYLARYVNNEGKEFDLEKANQEWKEFCTTLRSAWRHANAEKSVSSMGLGHRPRNDSQFFREACLEVGAPGVSEATRKREKTESNPTFSNSESQNFQEKYTSSTEDATTCGKPVVDDL